MALINFSSPLFIFILIILNALAYEATSRAFNDETTMLKTHEQWMARHGRVYASNEEKETRYKIFKDNVEFIEKFNSVANRTFKLGVNKFADLTTEEFKASYTGNVMPPRGSSFTSSFKYEGMSDAPPSVDWRDEGAVTPVKDQGPCGCCWAFTSVASIEGLNKIQTGQLISLSEQEILDCDGIPDGCNGNYVQNAFNFVINNQGLSTESDYPYTGVEGTCDTTKTTSVAAKITSFETVPPYNEEALRNAVANQPVSVTVDGKDPVFHFYQSGILSGECGVEGNHAITAIGYGTSDDGTKFWIFKNSWGTDWGENGFIRMQRDISSEGGQCGITKGGWYPTA